MAGAALQVPDFRELLGPLSEARRAGPLSWRRCAILEELCHQVEDLQQEVSMLCSIREHEKRIVSIFSEILQLEEP